MEDMSIPTSRHHKLRPAAPTLLIDGNADCSYRKRAAFLRAAVVAAFAMPFALVASPATIEAAADEAVAEPQWHIVDSKVDAAAADATTSDENVEDKKAPVVVSAAASVSQSGKKR